MFHQKKAKTFFSIKLTRNLIMCNLVGSVLPVLVGPILVEPSSRMSLGKGLLFVDSGCVDNNANSLWLDLTKVQASNLT